MSRRKKELCGIEQDIGCACVGVFDEDDIPKLCGDTTVDADVFLPVLVAIGTKTHIVIAIVDAGDVVGVVDEIEMTS